MQVILHGVLPQVFPQFADVSMYRWEYNFRASTVMGMVGAGGIGTELVGSLRQPLRNDVAKRDKVKPLTRRVCPCMGSTQVESNDACA